MANATFGGQGAQDTQPCAFLADMVALPAMYELVTPARPQPQSAVRIYIAIPAYGGWTRNACASSLMRLASRLTAAGIDFNGMIVDSENIAAVRNFYASLALQEAMTHILFVDYDIEFESQTVFKMMQAQKPVIGAVCARRPQGRMLYEGMPPLLPNVGLATADRPLNKPLDTVASIGMGLTLIETQALRALINTGKLKKQERHDFGPDGLTGPLFGFFDRADDGSDRSEDISFCRRWRELCNGEIWALSGEDIGHIGDMVWRLPR